MKEKEGEVRFVGVDGWKAQQRREEKRSDRCLLYTATATALVDHAFIAIPYFFLYRLYAVGAASLSVAHAACDSLLPFPLSPHNTRSNHLLLLLTILLYSHPIY